MSSDTVVPSSGAAPDRFRAELKSSSQPSDGGASAWDRTSIALIFGFSTPCRNSIVKVPSLTSTVNSST